MVAVSFNRVVIIIFDYFLQLKMHVCPSLLMSVHRVGLLLHCAACPLGGVVGGWGQLGWVRGSAGQKSAAAKVLVVTDGG